MPIWGWIILVVLLFAAYRLLTRKRRSARRKRKAERRKASIQGKQARKTGKYQRRTGRRGTVTSVAFCQETHNGQSCGKPVAKCYRDRLAAEHAEGMLGPRRKR